jgi:hypothetical protein
MPADARPGSSANFAALRHVLGRRRRLVRQVVEAIAAEPPTKAWYVYVTPILVSTALVGIALLFSVVQALFDV